MINKYVKQEENFYNPATTEIVRLKSTAWKLVRILKRLETIC
jgi:hypothetical protein